MKKLLKIIPVFLIALLCAVFFVPNFTKTTSYADATTENYEVELKNFTYTGETLLRSANGKIFVIEATKNPNYSSVGWNDGVLSYTYNESKFSKNNISYYVAEDGSLQEFTTKYHITDVCYFKGNYYFTSERGIYVSNDLLNFNLTEMDVFFETIDCSSDYIMAVSKTAEIFVSSDGITWKEMFDRSNLTDTSLRSGMITQANKVRSLGSQFFVFGGGYLAMFSIYNNQLLYYGNQYKFGKEMSTMRRLDKDSNGNLYVVNKNSVDKIVVPENPTNQDDFSFETVLTSTDQFTGFHQFDENKIFYSTSGTETKFFVKDTSSGDSTLIHKQPYYILSNGVETISDPNNAYYFKLNTSTGVVTLCKYVVYNKLTVKFINYNDELIEFQSVSSGNYATEPSTTPTRTGYTFTGWDKDPKTTPITEDTVFVAQFSINKYTVSFKDKFGETIKSVEIEYGSVLKETDIPEVPDLEGLAFSGWNRDLSLPITEDTSIYARYSEYVKLTFKYMTDNGRTFGLLNQFKNMSEETMTFEFKIGDSTNTTDLLNFLESLKIWQEDFSSDGKYDYKYLFKGWDKEIPTIMTEHTTITATYEKLNNVRLEYYSQLRFPIENNYYYCFIGYMKIERLLPTGSKINIDDFKRSDVDYEIYNASRDVFYNNLVGFNFLNWDKNIEDEVVDDVIIKAVYEMPTFNVKYYDADKYLIDETNEEIAFMGIEDLITILNTAKSYTDRFKTLMKNFLTFRFNANLDEIADKVDLSIYMARVKKYNNKSTLLITPYVVMDTDRPDVYSGIFTNGTIHVDSAVLQKFGGSQESHNLSYWISPIMFTTTAYPMSATVSYTNVLDSSIKSIKSFFGAVGGFFVSIWNGLKSAWNVIWKVSIALIIIGLVVFILLHYKDDIKKLAQKRKKQKQEYKSTKKQYKNSKNGTNKK